MKSFSVVLFVILKCNSILFYKSIFPHFQKAPSGFNYAKRNSGPLSSFDAFSRIPGLFFYILTASTTFKNTQHPFFSFNHHSISFQLTSNILHHQKFSNSQQQQKTFDQIKISHFNQHSKRLIKVQ